MLASKSVLQRPLAVGAPKPLLFRPQVNKVSGSSSSAPRFVCRSAGDATPPAGKSVDRPKITLRDVVNQLEPVLKEGEKPKPWIVSRFLIFRKLTKRMRLRRLGRRFLPKLLARLGRGVIVALPAIGLLFVASLAIQDFKRMKEEVADDHEAGFIAFAIATFCDGIDVIAHVVALVGLLYIHYSVGIPIPADIAHTADVISPIIVLVSFVSATVGELLSAMRAAQLISMSSGEDEDFDEEMVMVAAPA